MPTAQKTTVSDQYKPKPSPSTWRKEKLKSKLNPGERPFHAKKRETEEQIKPRRADREKSHEPIPRSVQQKTGKQQRELLTPKAGTVRSIKLISLLPEDQRKKNRMQVTNLRSERGNIVTDATDVFLNDKGLLWTILCLGIERLRLNRQTPWKTQALLRRDTLNILRQLRKLNLQLETSWEETCRARGLHWRLYRILGTSMNALGKRRKRHAPHPTGRPGGRASGRRASTGF